LDDIKIVEKGSVAPGATMLFGFPDVGLVGVIAASHLIDELKMSEVAYIDSQQLPPIIVLHEGLPHSTIRIFAGHNLILAAAETPIAADMIYPVMDSLIEWGKNKKVRTMISLSGLPVQERQDLQELKVFGAASSADMLKTVESKGIETLTEGYMVGPQAVMLLRCAQLGVPAIALLAQCFLNYPDPEAAAEVLKTLDKLAGIKVEVAKLLEKGEEIRLKARDVMRRTQEEMSKMKKGQEYDIPVYVT
jgi:uncharacterized protein